MKTKKRNNRPKGKTESSRDGVAELCEMIEEATTPQGIFRGLCGDTACGDPYMVIYHFLEAARPDYVEDCKLYESLMKKVDNFPEGHRLYMDIDHAAGAKHTAEHDIFFLAGSLLGMSIAGKPIDEVRKLASSIVARG